MKKGTENRWIIGFTVLFLLTKEKKSSEFKFR